MSGLGGMACVVGLSRSRSSIAALTSGSAIQPMMIQRVVRSPTHPGAVGVQLLGYHPTLHYHHQQHANPAPSSAGMRASRATYSQRTFPHSQACVRRELLPWRPWHW